MGRHARRRIRRLAAQRPAQTSDKQQPREHGDVAASSGRPAPKTAGGRAGGHCKVRARAGFRERGVRRRGRGVLQTAREPGEAVEAEGTRGGGRTIESRSDGLRDHVRPPFYQFPSPISIPCPF